MVNNGLLTHPVVDVILCGVNAVLIGSIVGNDIVNLLPGENLTMGPGRKIDRLISLGFAGVQKHDHHHQQKEWSIANRVFQLGISVYHKIE
jgi:hypothetical protein